jgi:hypothetical protein
VVGAVFGGITLSKASAAKSYCSADLMTCDTTGGQLMGAAHTTAHVADAAFALGGAAVVAGVVVFATAPNGSGSPVSVGTLAGAGTMGVVVRGGF